MIKTANLSQLNNQRGAVGLEFTIIFPLLLMVTFGIIEFGVLMFDKAILTNAAREAARAATSFDYDETVIDCGDLGSIRTDVDDVVNRYLRHNLSDGTFGNLFLINFDPTNEVFEDNDINVSVEQVNGEYVLHVTVRYTFNFIIIDSIINLLSNGALSDGIPLDAEVKMRGEDQRLLRELVEQGCT